MTAANVSRIPANAPKPQDRKPRKTAAEKKAELRQAEAEDGYLCIEQCGMELKIPVAGKVPLKAAIAFDKGQEIEGIELLLGTDQWNAFLEKDPTLDDFTEVCKRFEEVSGN